MQLKIGMKITGVVTGVQPYGVFVDIGDKKQGLIYISECKAGYVDNINRLFKVGQMVEALVIDIDEYSGKVSLSTRSQNARLDVLQHLSLNRPQHIHYWTNYRLQFGFSSIARLRDQWLSEADELFK